jgi:hypothetical protein
MTVCNEHIICDTLNASLIWGFLIVKIKLKTYIVYEYMIDSDQRLHLKSAYTDVIISNQRRFQILRSIVDLLLSNWRPIQSEDQIYLYLVTWLMLVKFVHDMHCTLFQKVKVSGMN